MNREVFIFKLERGLEKFCDFFKDLSNSIEDFLRKIIYHPKTEQAGLKIKRVKNKVLRNFKENTQNWKHRNLDNHGFSIDNEDI